MNEQQEPLMLYYYRTSKNGQEFTTPSYKVAMTRTYDNNEVFVQEVEQ